MWLDLRKLGIKEAPGARWGKFVLPGPCSDSSTEVTSTGYGVTLPASNLPAVIYQLGTPVSVSYYMICLLSTILTIDSSQPLGGCMSLPNSLQIALAAFPFLPVPIITTLFKEKYPRSSYHGIITSLFPQPERKGSRTFSIPYPFPPTSPLIPTSSP